MELVKNNHYLDHDIAAHVMGEEVGHPLEVFGVFEFGVQIYTNRLNFAQNPNLYFLHMVQDLRS